MATPEPLELDVIAPPRAAVKLRSSLHEEPRLYELYYQSELSMEDVARITTVFKQLEPLVRMLHDMKEFTPTEGRRFDDWLKEVFSIIFAEPIEPEVFDEMGYIAKWRVVQHFGLHCFDQPQALQEMIDKGNAVNPKYDFQWPKETMPKRRRAPAKKRTGTK